MEILHKKQGYAMPLVLVFVITILIAQAALFTRVFYSGKNTIREIQYMRSFYAAWAGIERGRWRVMENNIVNEIWTFDNIDIDIDITDNQDGTYKISSTVEF